MGTADWYGSGAVCSTSDRSVDIRIARLRKKIEPDPEQPQYLKTVRGAGYLFVPAPRKPV